jgi:hypothetical protein
VAPRAWSLAVGHDRRRGAVRWQPRNRSAYRNASQSASGSSRARTSSVGWRRPSASVERRRWNRLVRPRPRRSHHLLPWRQSLSLRPLRPRSRIGRHQRSRSQARARAGLGEAAACKERETVEGTASKVGRASWRRSPEDHKRNSPLLGVSGFSLAPSSYGRADAKVGLPCAGLPFRTLGKPSVDASGPY